jgi:hypothetical protein
MSDAVSLQSDVVRRSTMQLNVVDCETANLDPLRGNALYAMTFVTTITMHSQLNILQLDALLHVIVYMQYLSTQPLSIGVNKLWC